MYVSQNYRLFLCTATIITCDAELSSKFPWLSLARKRKMLDINKWITSKYTVKKVNINCMQVYDFKGQHIFIKNFEISQQEHIALND